MNGFPDINLKYTTKVCNYNEGANNIHAVGGTALQFYYPNPQTGNQQYFLQNSLAGQVLGPGECREEVGEQAVTSSRASYYLKSLLQGPSKTQGGDNVDDGYCYAYAFNVVDFKYDYGLPPCDVSVSDDIGDTIDDTFFPDIFLTK